MGRYWRVIADYDAETQTYSACAGVLQTSPYTPDEDARLTGLRVIPCRTAATTLTSGIQFRLTCTTFKPNTIQVFGVGTGLQTAPASAPPIVDYTVNQNVKAGVPVTIEARCQGASDVTNDVVLLGMFES